MCRINGLTHINLTKLDVLSDLATISLGVAYELDGVRSSKIPSEIADLERVEVIYEDVPGWQSDISKVCLLSLKSQGMVWASEGGEPPATAPQVQMHVRQGHATGMQPPPSCNGPVACSRSF